ncbi:hypothetical protein PCANC_00662 [Puccinia coronata f. sp. avenae]|uniref:Uncharacterized protein n=1 Tax=Puccinia coronata f. sp. avenae TaxID=200324 RepID=A0A2N5W728_9BASI|nr:hypothetical protein PCANC_00662 [Puccinia coronata f. sp. avenae]
MHHVLILLLLLQVVHPSYESEELVGTAADGLDIAAALAASHSSDTPEKSSKSPWSFLKRNHSRKEKGKAKIDESPAVITDSDTHESLESKEADLKQQSESLALAWHFEEEQLLEMLEMAQVFAEQEEVSEPPTSRDAAPDREDQISKDERLARQLEGDAKMACDLELSFRNSDMGYHPPPPSRDEVQYSQRRADQPHGNPGQVNEVRRRRGDEISNHHHPTREASPRHNRAPPASHTKVCPVHTDSLREEDNRGVGLEGIPFVVLFYVALFILAKLAVSSNRLFSR